MKRLLIISFICINSLGYSQSSKADSIAHIKHLIDSIAHSPDHSICDTFDYCGVHLEEFYGKKVKSLLKEIHNKGYVITYCRTEDGDKGADGLILRFGEDPKDELFVYFNNYVPDNKYDYKKNACESKVFLNSKINRYTVLYYSSDIVIKVKPRSEWVW